MSDQDDDDDDHDMEEPQTVLEDADEDTLRIMLSTDNHLGYAERDPVRGMDSFAAFEEVLYLAKRFQCDMVLIAGDLFHDNRPSRRCLHKTMEILRRYCMGPNPVKIQILSDARKNFRGRDSVNYQDEHYSVDLPLFSIHGNHDDPSRDAGGELLAALDILSVSNLVNYFGRQDQVDKVEISPVLLQKGTTHVAMYGLGSMRDERLNRMWQSKKVRFLRPEEDHPDDDNNEREDGFFNLFTLHQNRDLGRGSKNCVQESMIPEWMDLVVWGHEHECLIELNESVVGTFRITQPGSSVATSLVAGEAVLKQVGILDIKGKNFRLHPVPLTQVRSFVTTEVCLREHHSMLDPEDPKIEDKMTKVLTDEVKSLILTARDRLEELSASAQAAGSNADTCRQLQHRLHEPSQVLVRIRVDHAGFESISNQRFGAKFVGQVANPTDILLFSRRKGGGGASKDKQAAGKKRGKASLPTPLAPEELERTNMEDLVMEHLEAPERKLKLLNKKKLSLALEEYVDKSVAATIGDTTASMLLTAQKRLIQQAADADTSMDKGSQVRDLIETQAAEAEAAAAAAADTSAEQDSRVDESTMVDDSMESAAAPSSKRKRTNVSLDDDDDDPSPGKENSLDLDEDDDEPPPARGGRSVAAAAKKPAPRASRKAATDTKRKAARQQMLDSEAEEEDDEKIEVLGTKKSKPAPKRTTTTRGGRGRAAASKSRSYAEEDDWNDDEAAFIDDDIEDDDDEEEEPAPKKRGRGRAAPTTTRKKATTRKTTTTTRKGRNNNKSRLQDSSDEEDDEDDDDDDVFEVAAPPKRGRVKKKKDDSLDMDDDWGSANTRSQVSSLGR